MKVRASVPFNDAWLRARQPEIFRAIPKGTARTSPRGDSRRVITLITRRVRLIASRTSRVGHHPSSSLRGHHDGARGTHRGAGGSSAARRSRDAVARRVRRQTTEAIDESRSSLVRSVHIGRRVLTPGRTSPHARFHVDARWVVDIAGREVVRSVGEDDDAMADGGVERRVVRAVCEASPAGSNRLVGWHRRRRCFVDAAGIPRVAVEEDGSGGRRRRRDRRDGGGVGDGREGSRGV